MQWNYQKIEYFLKVAETLNFTKAASELYISTQSLNKQIIMMEQELGEPLFVRSTRAVALTDTGKRMQKCFAPAIAEFQRASKEMDTYFNKKKNKIRVAFFQAISKNEAVAPIVYYLRKFHPELHVEMVGGEMDDMIAWLYQGKCDLIITNIHDFEEWPETEIVSFTKVPAKVAVSATHPWAQRKQITKADLEEGTFLALERNKPLEKDSFYTNLRSKHKEYTPNFSSMVANLEVGDSYAVIPELFESMNRAGLIYLDLPEEYRFYYRMAVIYRKEHPKKEVFDLLKTYASQEPIKMT